ncbi:MAG: long-chain fatty acid--CoA ligase [Thermodesulfobacteriota bacterium]
METQLMLSKQLVIGEFLARWSRKEPAREALVYKEQRYTYRDLNERVNRLANGLKSLGIGRSDKVALLMTNCNQMIECYCAICKLGAVAVPLNFRLAGPEIAYQIDNSDACLLIFGQSFLDLVHSVSDQFANIEAQICVGGSEDEKTRNYEDFLSSFESSEPLVPIEDDDPAFILYTSGTTGKPKGAVMTHKNLLLNALITTLEIPGTPYERCLCSVPLFHAGGLSTFLKILLVGGTFIITDQFDPVETLDLIEREQVSYLLLVPAMWIQLLETPEIVDYDTSSLKRALTAASIMPVSVKSKILEYFPNARLSDSFGQTEMGPVATTLKPEDVLRKKGSVGRPCITVETRIVDTHDNDVPQGQVGEIIYRGPTVMKEYYKNPQATTEAMRNGWFHSGDLVKADEEGFIYVVDRLKDIIISGGENIYAVEVEETLYSHPAVLEAAVIGVPDPKWEEAVKAIVVLKEGYQATEPEIIEHCRQNLASYKKPKSVVFVDSLPKNATGKVLKFKLREQYKTVNTH